MIVAAVILAIIIAVSVLASISYSEHFLFRRDLSLTLVNQTSAGLPECDYLANIIDSNVNTGGYIFVRVEPAMVSNQHPVYLDIQNPTNVEVDTVTLTFDSSQITFIYFQNHFDVSYTAKFISNDVKSCEIHVDNNSGAAWGGSTYKFVLYTHDVSGNFNMSLTVDLAMHEKSPLQLTEVHAIAQIDVNLHQ